MRKPTLESNNQSTHPNQDSTGKTGPSGSIWRAQPWYPILLEMLIHRPVLLPNNLDLIQSTHRVNRPDMISPLDAWTILVWQVG